MNGYQIELRIYCFNLLQSYASDLINLSYQCWNVSLDHQLVPLKVKLKKSSVWFLPNSNEPLWQL